MDQEEQIRAMLEDVLSDLSYESSSEQETDHCSEHQEGSGTEQEDNDSVDVSYNTRQVEMVENDINSDPEEK